MIDSIHQSLIDDIAALWLCETRGFRKQLESLLGFRTYCNRVPDVFKIVAREVLIVEVEDQHRLDLQKVSDYADVCGEAVHVGVAVRLFSVNRHRQVTEWTLLDFEDTVDICDPEERDEHFQEFIVESTHCIGTIDGLHEIGECPVGRIRHMPSYSVEYDEFVTGLYRSRLVKGARQCG